MQNLVGSPTGQMASSTHMPFMVVRQTFGDRRLFLCGVTRRDLV